MAGFFVRGRIGAMPTDNRPLRTVPQWIVIWLFAFALQLGVEYAIHFVTAARTGKDVAPVDVFSTGVSSAAVIASFIYAIRRGWIRKRES
jgi:hypothetical protein